MRIVRSATVGEATLLLPLDAPSDALDALHAVFRLHAGGVTADCIARTAWAGRRRLPLTPREFALLVAMMRRPGEAIARAALLAEVWGLAGQPGSNLVEVHLSRLRAKLGDAGAGVRIETLAGRGWRLVADA